MFVNNCQNSTYDQEDGVLNDNCKTYPQDKPGNPGVGLVVRLCVENAKHDTLSSEISGFMVLENFHVEIEFLPIVY